MIIDQWRKHKVNIYDINFESDFQILEEISFPHASNELTEVRAIREGVEGEYIVKISRRDDSDLFREYKVLSILQNKNTPEVVEYGKFGDNQFLVIRKVPGNKMSMINNDNELTLEHLRLFGESLAKIHSLDVNDYDSPKRKFHSLLDYDDFINNIVNPWLEKNRPKKCDKCFCHGDHHYANVLFDAAMNYYVLDWELSGIGDKEFDIAWARVLRPGQEFFKTSIEEDAFLEGYGRILDYDISNYRWFKVLISSHFYKIGIETNQLEYAEYLKKDILSIIE